MRETGRTGVKAHLVKVLRELFPGCVILHLDPNTNFQGCPDLLVLYGDRWAVLETKASLKAAKQPNQPYYIEQFDSMSFGAFISPETEEDVLRDLQYALRPRAGRRSRVS